VVKKKIKISQFLKIVQAKVSLVVNENKNRWRQCFFTAKLRQKLDKKIL